MAGESENHSNEALIERLYRHGGDIKSAMLLFPNAPRPWIDLSTGLNPVAYPVPAIRDETWAHLPEPLALVELQQAAGFAYGAETNCVVAASGTQALLQILPHLFPAQRVSILGPTYAEHERTWRASGADIEIVDDLDGATGAQVVVVNPNNPDGRTFSRRRMGDYSRKLAGEKRRLIVDEAFMDFETETIAGERLPATIVLRSFGKAFGLAGLRLGFAVAEHEVADAIRAALGPWPVSGPAIAVGLRALNDRDWQENAGRRLDEDGCWLDSELAHAGFSIVGRTRLFRLARHANGRRAFEQLCGHGVLTRPFAWDSGLLRFGVPTSGSRGRVQVALASCLDC